MAIKEEAANDKWGEKVKVSKKMDEESKHGKKI